MTSIILVNLLGPPEVRWGDEIITIHRRNPRALLFYLAHQKVLVSRDELVSLLWPDTVVSSARRRLNENLSRLRASLPDSKLIISEGDLLGLNADRVKVDSRLFDLVIAQVGSLPWRIPNDQPLPDRFVHSLSGALALWRGSHFLLGNKLPSTPELDHWLAQATSHYEYHRLNILERLAYHYYLIGDNQRAWGLARDGLALDRINNDLHLLVMQCLIDQGRTREARKHYHDFQEIIRNEPFIDDSPEMDALFAKLDQEQVGGTFMTTDWKLHPSVSIPFIGRRDVLGKLRQFYNRHKNVGILGESGSGKTRLIQEFTRQIQPPPRIFVAACRSYESSLPFQPITEILRRGITPEEWLALPPIWASHLMLLLPELGNLRPELEIPTIPVNPVQAQAILFEAIRQVFLLIHQAQPVILVIDDAHWADEATLSAMIYLHSRPPYNQDAFLVVLARQESLTPYLEEMYAAVDNDPQVEIIYLSGLLAQDITELTRIILKGEPSREFIQNLLVGTGGNILFVLEALRDMMDLDLEIINAPNFKFSLSNNLLKLIQARIHLLESKPRAIVEVAAVLGSQFDLRMLIRVSLESDTTIVDALDYLERRMILHPVPASDGRTRYRFVHDKFREALLINISPAKAALIHERVADIIEKNHRPEQTAVLAHHKQAAGKHLDAFRYWIETGNHARSLLSRAEANSAYSQAESIIPAIENELSVDDLYTLYAAWCEMATETHQVEKVQILGNRLLAFGEKRQSPLLIGTALDTLSDAAMMENRFKEGLDLATRAIPYLERSGKIFEQMEAQIHRGVFFYMQNRFKDAITAFETALTLGVGHGSPGVIQAKSNAHYQISLLQTLAGWPERGREHANLSLEAAQKYNHTYPQTAAYFVLTLSSYYLAEFHRAHQYAQTGIEQAERAQGWRMLGYLSGYAAAVDLTMGQVDMALTQALKTIELGEQTNLNDVIAMGCRHAGDVYNRLGASEIAVQYYLRGVGAGGEHFLGIDNLIRLGFMQSMSGQMQTGRQTLADTLAATKKLDLGLGVIVTEFFQALVYLAEGDWENAGRLARKVRDETNIKNLPTYYCDSIAILGRLAIQSGDVEQAIDQIRVVAEESRLVGNVWSELNAQILLNQLYQHTSTSGPEIGKRVSQLLSILEANTQSEALGDIFLAFKANIHLS